MRITLLGYGKMGQAIEAEALQRGHQISHRIDRHNYQELDSLSKDSTDLVIEFTHPESFESNLRAILAKGLPVVVGTTGWYDRIDEFKKEVEAVKGSFMYASNFSVGVNLFFKLNQRLAELMNPHVDYDPYLEEQHHRYKADGPSGTAHTLARDLIMRLDRKTRLSDEQLRNRAPQDDELSVSFSRAGEIKGTHRVVYTSEIDSISIEHRAHNRRGFAQGAVIGAEWLLGKRGFYEFSEIF